ALPRCMAGVVHHRCHMAGSDVRRGASTENPGHLQAPVAEGLGSVPGARRQGVLAARRGEEYGYRQHDECPWTCRVLRDGSVRNRVATSWRATGAVARHSPTTST